VTSPVLHLADVLVSAAGRPILDVDHLAVPPGEALALVGPNGAGKTTLLHVAALLRRPDRGAVTILGQPVTATNAAALRRSLSLVFQDPLLFNVSVRENAAAGGRFQGLPRIEAERRARHWLQRFGVSHLAPRKARGLSGGEARRVALARAFATYPAIVLLDEPFSALDAPTRGTLLPALREQLVATDSAAILVTHDLDEALAFADRLALIERGQIIAIGEPHTLIARPPSQRAAELLGIETILPARVSRQVGDRVHLTIEPDGPSVQAVALVAGITPFASGVTLTLPPGAARILPPREAAPEGWNVLLGRVVSTTPHLAGTRLVVETPARIAVLTPWDALEHHWSYGDVVTIVFPAEMVHLIPLPG
jgi:tungstate transport system ATP-binding protein